MESFKKYLSELVGTFLLVFFGCGTAALVGGGGIGTISVALSFGLTYLALFYCFGSISGCQLNPAVSIAMTLMRKMNAVDCLGYTAAQLVGGIGGSAILYAIFRNSALTDQTGDLAANSASGLGGFWVALIVEAILTFAFALTYIRATQRNEYSSVSGAVIGLSLTVVTLLGYSVTGASVNPARSLGPALFARGEALKELWIFIAAPIIGALIAALLSLFLERKSTKSAQRAA